MKNSNRSCMMMSMIMVAVIVLLLCKSRKSAYTTPAPQEIKVGNVKGGSLFDLPNKLNCVPGPTKEASYYTQGLTPGGVCGAQEFVQDQSGYSIEEGIGGSLLH